MRTPAVLPLVLLLAACGRPTRSYDGHDVVALARTEKASGAPSVAQVQAAQRDAFAKAAFAAIGDRLDNAEPDDKVVVETLTSMLVAMDKDLVPAVERALVSEEKSERAGALHVLANGGAGIVRAAKRGNEVDAAADKSGADKELVRAAREALQR